MRKNHWAITLLAAALVAGCGSDKGEGVAPPDSVIVTQPDEINWTYSGSWYTANTAPVILPQRFVTVTVLNSSGSPVRGATVTLYNAGDNTIVSSDRNGTFLTPQLEPYVTTTDDFGNVYVYIFSIAHDAVGTREYDFQAFSGGAYKPLTISMTCEDTDTTTAGVCD